MEPSALALYFARFYQASGGVSNNQAYQNFAQQQSALATNYLTQFGLTPQQVFDPNLDLSPGGFFENMTGLSNSYLSMFPFGSMAGANLGGSSAFFSPFASPQYNINSALTTPFTFNPQFVNLPSLEQIVGTLQPPTAQELPSGTGTDTGSASGGLIDTFFDWSTTVNDLFKKFGILLFALVLIVLGLYFLAKSTDAGQIAIGAAKKVATSGAL